MNGHSTDHFRFVELLLSNQVRPLEILVACGARPFPNQNTRGSNHWTDWLAPHSPGLIISTIQTQVIARIGVITPDKHDVKSTGWEPTSTLWSASLSLTVCMDLYNYMVLRGSTLELSPQDVKNAGPVVLSGF